MDSNDMNIESLKAQYAGKDIHECFAQLNLKFNIEIQDIKVQLNSVREKSAELENFMTYANQEFQTLHEKTIPDLEGKIEAESEERLKLELWGRKWNLVVKGITGANAEKPRETDSVVRTFLTTTLKMPEEAVTAMPFQAVHRLPGGTSDSQTKNILVRFSSLIDRDEVLMAARTKIPRGTGYSVVPDLPPILNKLRSQLLYKLKNMEKSERKKHKLVYLKDPPFVAIKAKNI